MTYSRRKLDWMVKVGWSTFTADDPGGLKGDIVLEYNSVGACVGGSLTFDGYYDWQPYSGLIEVYALGQRIGYGVIGMVSSTLSPTGQRTTTVPILGLHVVDADGLIAAGMPPVALLGIGSPTDQIETEIKETDALGIVTTKTIMVDPPFGETVQAGLQRMFKGNPLASWGVQPSGQYVAGIPYGGSVLGSQNPDGLRVQPANYEISQYVSEFVKRVGDRWVAKVHQRGLSAYWPRKGASVQSDELLADVQTIAPLSLTSGNFEGQESRDGYFVATANIRDIVARSINNPKAHNVDYQPVGIVVDIRVWFEASALPLKMPDDWRGQNIESLGTWQDSPREAVTFVKQQIMNEEARQGLPESAQQLTEFVESENFPPSLFTVRQNAETKEVTQRDLTFWHNKAQTYQGPSVNYSSDPDMTDLLTAYQNDFPRRKEKYVADYITPYWDTYLSQVRVNVQWGEWLTKSAIGEAEKAVYQVSPVLNPTEPVNPHATAGASSPFELAVLAMERMAWELDPSNFLAANAQYALDPRKDTGLLKPLYVNTATLDTGARRELVWRFAVPKELLNQLDPTLGEDYLWAVGCVFSGLRLGLNAKGEIVSTAYYAKKMTGTTDVQKNLPAYLVDPAATATYQGVAHGEIHTGPAMVMGQQCTNLRVIIAKDDYRTEFQTGAANGGRQ